MYYPCSENKGPDQLLGYREHEADLRLYFRIGGSNVARNSATLYEPRHEKTGFLTMRKQRRRTADQHLRFRYSKFQASSLFL